MFGCSAAVVGVALAVMVPLSASAQQDKLAQTGLKFLSVSVDPRSAGLGDAVTAIEGGSEMLFHNPAGMARQEGAISLSVGQMSWIADIEYNAASVSFKPAGGRLGVIGFSLVSVSFGEIEETIRFDNEQGFLDVGRFEPSAWSVGVGYSRELTDRFSVGGIVKYVSQDLGNSIIQTQGENDYTRSDNTAGVAAFDFGVLYKTGFRSMNFAVTARNFSREIEYEEESFQLPLTLRIGLSMDLLDLRRAGPGSHTLLMSVDAENPRDFSEQMNAGLEYAFQNRVMLRAGYTFPTDEQGLTAGLGVSQPLGSLRFGADYSYTEFGVFSGVHRLALRFSM